MENMRREDEEEDEDEEDEGGRCGDRWQWHCIAFRSVLLGVRWGLTVIALL